MLYSEWAGLIADWEEPIAPGAGLAAGWGGVYSMLRGHWSFLGWAGFAPTLEILGMGTGTLGVGDAVGGHLGVRTPVL